MRSATDDVELAIVMPAYNAARLLPLTLPPLIAAAKGAKIIVVDPGSTDDTVAVASQFEGVQVHSLGHRAGPAEARNAGVDKVAAAAVVLFVDADCASRDDTVDRVRQAFSMDDNLVTLTGSYCDQPADPGFFSRYMNLRHHYTHQNANTENATFWAGCGAVRRKNFVAVGGFDAKQFPRPMIEDIELGLRMAKSGATRLDPLLQVTHLKVWSLSGVVLTDIFCRAVPWTALIRRGGEMPNDLNLKWTQRLGALWAPVVLLSPLTLLLWPQVGPYCLLVPVLTFFVATQLSGHLWRGFRRSGGLGFALLALTFHQFHLFYSAVTFVLCGLFGGKGAASRSDG